MEHSRGVDCYSNDFFCSTFSLQIQMAKVLSRRRGTEIVLPWSHVFLFESYNCGCEGNNLLTFLLRREVVPPEASLRDIKFRDGMLKASWRCVGRNFEARQALPCEHKYSNSTICNFSHWTSTPIILKFKCKCRKNLRLVGREGLLCSSKLFRINSISFQTSIF